MNVNTLNQINHCHAHAIWKKQHEESGRETNTAQGELAYNGYYSHGYGITGIEPAQAVITFSTFIIQLINE